MGPWGRVSNWIQLGSGNIDLSDILKVKNSEDLNILELHQTENIDLLGHVLNIG